MPDQAASPVISSDRVNGTAAHDVDGRPIGTIDHLLIDKASGRIVYAVVACGGFLGMGQDRYPIPWGALRYDTALGGYATGLTEQTLRGAPPAAEGWSADRRWEEAAHAHFGLPFYWI